MEQILASMGFGNGLPLVPLAVLMLLAGGAAITVPLFAGRSDHADVKRRLRVDQTGAGANKAAGVDQKGRLRARATKSAQEFYAKTDPENVARLRLKLIQAGYLEPTAVGNFFLIRFVTLVGAFVGALVLGHLFGDGTAGYGQVWLLALLAGAFGYFVPGLVLAQRVKASVREHRSGFPDFMDLMIVCSDAGLTMEAGIERVSKEIALSYPLLSANLQIVSLELRAGRNLEDALRSLGDRLCLDEVRSFATLLQQSKELGTSLSGALRVFSDEMRNKRMSRAEEKAHALPAKMSIPVTVCILPVVLLIAIIPVIVKFNLQ